MNKVSEEKKVRLWKSIFYFYGPSNEAYFPTKEAAEGFVANGNEGDTLRNGIWGDPEPVLFKLDENGNLIGDEIEDKVPGRDP